jgi:hypothetical protein
MDDAARFKALGRKAGWAYLAVFLFSIAGYLPLSTWLAGDIHAVTQRLAGLQIPFDLALLASVIGFLAWLVLGVRLYRLMSTAGRTAGIVMMVFVVGGVASNLLALAQLVPVAVGVGAGMDAAALEPIVHVYNRTLLYAQVFSGLWCFPFGWLVVRSRIVPRIMGYCLYLAGAFYLMVFSTAFAPGLDQTQAYKIVSTALAVPGEFVGELGMCLWLLIMGARPPAPVPNRAARSSLSPAGA